jgi:hypothetical protein
MWTTEMCEESKVPKIEAQAFCYFRFFVYREYREVRYLGNPRIGVYNKFSHRYRELQELTRESFARRWCEIASERDLARIKRPFEDLTGLTLQEVEEAFRKGEWHPLKSVVKVFGGPYHAEIVLHTLRLGDAIAAGRWADLVPKELAVLKEIRHNCPRPARTDYKSLQEDLASLGLPVPACCLLEGL